MSDQIIKTKSMSHRSLIVLPDDTRKQIIDGFDKNNLIQNSLTFKKKNRRDIILLLFNQGR